MKKYAILLILGYLLFFKAICQGGWTSSQLPNLPFETSNNSVTSAIVNDTIFIYSFLGIDSTKIFSGIHTKSARYNTITQVWDTIPNVPDSLGGLIAAGASTVNNKIIIIGGYHVYSNNSEISAKHVHIYDPVTNSYSRGKDIPVEIDDHVQLTYKDSLIYIITGWTSTIGSNGDNTNLDQVYDAINDNWYSATSTPNTSNYKVFGASGTIIGDTIYYAGGARSGSFSLAQSLSKGVINSSNNLDITWSSDTVLKGFKPYRSACVNIKNKSFWIGGASNSYNYNGLAYSNNNGVEPNDFITEYNNTTNQWAQYSPTNFEIMDLRGIAKINPYSYVICGGMNPSQEVSKSVYLLTYDSTFTSKTDSIPLPTNTIAIQNNNTEILKLLYNDYIYILENKNVACIELIDLFGRTIKMVEGNTINTLGERGIFFLQVTFESGEIVSRKILVK